MPRLALGILASALLMLAGALWLFFRPASPDAITPAVATAPRDPSLRTSAVVAESSEPAPAAPKENFTDAARALALALANSPADPDAIAATAELAARRAETDAPATVAWIETLGDGPARDRALLRVAMIWSRRAPAAATRYFESLPPARQGDPVRAALSRAALAEDVGSAILWARTLNDPALRRKFLGDTLPALRRQSPSDAAALEHELAALQ
jgi:hypothetical protein